MNRDAIFDAAKKQKPVYAPVTVPEEYGGTWHVKRLTVAEYAEMQGGLEDAEKEDLGNAWFAICAVFDPETDRRVFNEHDLDNIKTLPACIVNEVWAVGRGLNGLGKKEDLEKNLPIPSDATS